MIAQAYTADSIWRNRTTFISGTAAIEQFLTQKWAKEKSYRLRKELFAFTDDKIAVQFWCVARICFALLCFAADKVRYEYQDAQDGMKWKRCYGLEDWTFAQDGKMRKRQMSGNDIEISEAGRIASPTLPIRMARACPCVYRIYADKLLDRWFKDGLDVNEVKISEAHW